MMIRSFKLLRDMFNPIARVKVNVSSMGDEYHVYTANTHYIGRIPIDPDATLMEIERGRLIYESMMQVSRLFTYDTSDGHVTLSIDSGDVIFKSIRKYGRFAWCKAHDYMHTLAQLQERRFG